MDHASDSYEEDVDLRELIQGGIPKSQDDNKVHEGRDSTRCRRDLRQRDRPSCLLDTFCRHGGLLASGMKDLERGEREHDSRGRDRKRKYVEGPSERLHILGYFSPKGMELG
jgi:hypothetical protein